MEYKRKKYLDLMIQLIDTNFIKTIVWLRRVWKSTLMRQFINEVWIDSCLYINMEDLNNSELLDYKKLHTHIIDNIAHKKYVLIDEIQLAPNRSLTINSLFTQYQWKVDFYITWSNSDLLSSEISTQLRGRTYEIIVYPLRYYEYLEYFQKDKQKETWNNYIQEWGLISSYQLPNQIIKYDYIKNIISTVFIKDIIWRYKIKDVNLLQELLLFLISNIGNKTNISNILEYVNTKWYNTNYTTLGSYLQYLIAAQLVYEAQTRDIKWKKVFDRERKYYVCDHILWYIYLGDTNQWFGKLYENIVYLTLLYYWYQIFVWKQWTTEIDFIAQKWNWQIYLQVSYILSDEKVIQREYSSLQEVNDNRPKYVFSGDELLLKPIDGIIHEHIRNLESILS